MAEKLFAENLSSALDLSSINRYFTENRKKTEEVLQKLRPEGRIDANRFKLASIEGGAGGSFDYNLVNGSWGDWAANNSQFGLVGFVCATMKCTPAQAVDYLVKEKFLDKKEAKKSLQDAEGDPLILPIPEDKQSWEVVLQADALRKDRGIIKHYWTYRDLDGTLLGYKYRVDSRNTSKEVYTVTYRAESGWCKKSWQKKIVPPYGLEYLEDGPTVRVLFVEGEKAADKARELVGDRWKVLGYSGVKGADEIWLPDYKVWDDCEIIIWPDNDVPGKEAARKIQNAIEKLEFSPREIRIVRVDALQGVPPGWDLGDWEEGCPVDVSVELARAEEVDSFEVVCREWAYVSQEDKFYNLEDRQVILSPVAFDRTYTRYNEKNNSPSKKFLSSLETRKAVDLDFLPGYDTFIRTGNGKLLLNEWYPSEVYSLGKLIAANPGISDEDIASNAKFFIDHLERVAGQEVVEPERDSDGNSVEGTEGRLLKDALAHFFSGVVKKPQDKQGWIPILVSEHNGTGKSYFRRIMSAILGGKRVQELTVAQYTSQYEDWMDGCLFYELNEAKSQTSSEVYELLKKNHSFVPFQISSLRDRSQGVRQVNIKGSKQKQQRNFMNGYITSNDLYPIALANSSGLDGSDRRLLAVNCEEIIPEPIADQMFDEINKKAEWVAAWLMRYKSPVPWNPGWAPITAHKRRMLEKDRDRSEARNDKYELGKYDEFYHLLNWAYVEKIGLMRRRVTSADLIRSFTKHHNVKWPWDVRRFDDLLLRVGLQAGPSVLIDGQVHKLYSIDPKMQGEPEKVWKEALRVSIDKATEGDDSSGGGHF